MMDRNRIDDPYRFFMQGNFSRRAFLRGACLASLGFIAGGKIFAAEGLNTAPIPGASISGSRALVGVARGKSVKESVRTECVNEHETLS